MEQPLLTLCYPINLPKLAISIAEIAESYPLFPAFVPARSIACSIFSVVTTPKITGTFHLLEIVFDTNQIN